MYQRNKILEKGNGLTNDEERPTCKPMYDSHVRYNN